MAFFQTPPDPQEPLANAPGNDSCCTNIWDLGCFTHCDTLDLSPLYAPVDGIYTLECKVLERVAKIEKEFLQNDALIFPNQFEIGSYQFKILAPSGEYIKLVQQETGVVILCNPTVDIDTTYDCFKFRTRIGQIVSTTLLPCSGSPAIDTVSYTNYSSRNNSRMYPIQVLELVAGNTNANRQLYCLTLTPNSDCELTDAIYSQLAIASSDANIIPEIHTPSLITTSDGTRLIRLYVWLVSTGTAGVTPVTFTITGLCNNCISLEFEADVRTVDCLVNPFIANIAVVHDPDWLESETELITGSTYTVPEDLDTVNLLLDIQRPCCNEDVTVTITPTAPPPGFVIQDSVTIPAGQSQVLIFVQVPDSFSVPVQFDFAGCSTTQTVSVTLER